MPSPGRSAGCPQGAVISGQAGNGASFPEATGTSAPRPAWRASPWNYRALGSQSLGEHAGRQGGALGRGQGSISHNPSKTQLCVGHLTQNPRLGGRGTGDSPQNPLPQKPLSELGGGSAGSRQGWTDSGPGRGQAGAGGGRRAGALGRECWPCSQVTAPGGGGGGQRSSMGGGMLQTEQEQLEIRDLHPL